MTTTKTTSVELLRVDAHCRSCDARMQKVPVVGKLWSDGFTQHAQRGVKYVCAACSVETEPDYSQTEFPYLVAKATVDGVPLLSRVYVEGAHVRLRDPPAE